MRRRLARIVSTAVRVKTSFSCAPALHNQLAPAKPYLTGEIAMPSQRALTYLEALRDRHVAQLCDFLRIPSISSVATHKDDVRRAADFVAEELRALGLKVELHEPAGAHPLVYAQTVQEPGRKTLLVYGHYDVQPVDPLDLWHTPPFEPRIENDTVYARGATDDKGQLYAHFKALEAYMEQDLPLPVNLKFLIEGEEECGGRSVYRFTEENAAKLACDAVAISDTSLYDERTPALTYSLRGIVYIELRVRGPNADLHSGSFGGAVQNPANALCQIIGALKDDSGRVLIPGFYDDVLDLDRSERAAFASLPFAEPQWRAEIGIDAVFGEAGYTTLERMWGRPTLDVNGLWSGYAGEGAKTIIPAEASAKVSMRLVPNQDPQKIAAAFADHVRRTTPPGVRVEIIRHHGARPVLVPRDAPVMRAAMTALERGFGARPVFIREGGSIPIVTTFQDRLRVPVLLLGFGLPTDNAHSPNEKFHLENFRRGARTVVHLYEEAARIG